MPIFVECEQCQKKYRLQDHLAGRRLPCKQCGAEFQVPGREADLFDDFNDTFGDELDDQFELDPSSKRRGRQKAGRSPQSGSSAGNSTPWIIIGAGSVAILVLLAVLFIGARVVRNKDQIAGGPEQDDIAGVELMAATTNADEPFAIGKVALPKFPELGRPSGVRGGAKLYEVDLNSVQQQGGLPGANMKMRVYLPPGEHQPGSLSCVLVAPAGSTLLTGNDLDPGNYHDETLPYVQAGMAVVFYSIDGGLRDMQAASPVDLKGAYTKFRAACAGVVNGRNALEFALARLPQVDPKRIYTAGHSSAGTLSLLLAQHDPRVKACIAYAPATDVEGGLREVLSDPQAVSMFPRLRGFLQQSSPVTHSSRLTCPVFLFHARDDSNIEWTDTQKFASLVEKAGTKPTLKFVPVGEHYDSMIDQGIPQAIAWLRTLPGESAGSSQQPQPAIAAASAPKPADNDENNTVPARPTSVPNSVAGGPRGPVVPSRIGTRRPTLPSIPGIPPGSRFTRQRPTLPNLPRSPLPSRSRPKIGNPADLFGPPPSFAGATNTQTKLVFRVLRLPTSIDGKNGVDVAQAASQALSTVPQFVPGSVKYDPKTHQLTVELKPAKSRVELFRQESDVLLALIKKQIPVVPVRSPLERSPAGKRPAAGKQPPAEKATPAAKKPPAAKDTPAVKEPPAAKKTPAEQQ